MVIRKKYFGEEGGIITIVVIIVIVIAVAVAVNFVVGFGLMLSWP